MKNILLCLGLLLVNINLKAADMHPKATAMGCVACHAIDKKVIGPSYMDIAKFYKNDVKKLDLVTKHVMDGYGPSETWKSLTGGVAMPPNKHHPEANLKEVVKWILELK